MTTDSLDEPNVTVLRTMAEACEVSRNAKHSFLAALAAKSGGDYELSKAAVMRWWPDAITTQCSHHLQVIENA